MLFVFSLILVLWVLVGVGMFWLIGRNPRSGGGPLVRRVDRRLCLTGERIRVTLECSAAGLPQPKPAAGTTPWDLVLVIDHSISMGTGTGSALHEARKAAINLVRTAPAGFRFSVVEFDDQAREVCPLTDRHAGLTRAIKEIVRGGGTDIALGLAVAGKSLEQADVTEAQRRRAVLLLSDGGSAADPAVAAADALKSDPDLLLITVGVGAADMALLRRLATTPDHSFHADRIEELTALYAVIGEMITGRKATEVRVTEHFAPTGRWGLRGWGELQPSALSLKDGEFSWLLGTLPETPLTLTYTLEALCPGWQSVAPAPALLRARTADGNERDCPSNRGPQVLILPRVPGWQVLWLVLNPLFFTLIGKRFCPEPAVAARVEPVPPVPEPLRDQPRLERLVPKEGALVRRPSLVLGLGYAGLQTVTHIKRLAWERGARVEPENLRFVAIDTADEVFLSAPAAGLVTLADDERLTLDAPLEPVIAAAAAATDPRYSWLDADRLAAGGARVDLHRGTGRRRTLGRLALQENRAVIEARLAPLIDALIARSAGAGIDVLITVGTGGGTGSGGLLDLCWLVRRLLTERGASEHSPTTLFLSTPHAEQSQDAHPEELALAQANHLALLRELDRFAVLRRTPQAPAPGLAPVPDWFDQVFCVGPVARARWSAEGVLYPKTAETAFAWLATNEPGGLRAQFAAADLPGAEDPGADGRCLLHRIDPLSHYLYPRTVATYLIIDTLRRTLAGRLWHLDGPADGGYGAGATPPTVAAPLLQSWLESRPTGTDYPWVFNAITALADPNRLQQSLHRGAGPEISGSVSPLARNELFSVQRQLVRATLATWVQDTLNGKRAGPGPCAAHALGPCLLALREFQRRLREGSDVAAHLIEHSPVQMVRREAETVAELTTQALAEIDLLVRRLTDWDQCLGDGVRGGGLLRLLDQRSGLLRAEIDVLRGIGTAPASETSRSPLLPLDWEQLGELSARFLGALDDRLCARLGWTLDSSGPQPALTLHLQGRTAHRWSAENLTAEGDAVAALADALIGMGSDLSPAFDDWTLADYPAETLPELRPESPRTDRLNPGAGGLYLVQGAPRFRAAAAVEQRVLTPCDRREARVVGCERFLASDLLWPERPTEEVPPFVYPEEHHAYRAYDSYCRAERRTPEPLPATLAALCRDPAALVGFALRGLAAGLIVAREEGAWRYWYLEDAAAGQGGRIELGRHDQDPLTVFLRVANAWTTGANPVLRQWERVPGERAADLGRRIARHELAAALGGEPWYEQFVAVVWGSLQWV